jgi:hypothetical protein
VRLCLHISYPQLLLLGRNILRHEQQKTSITGGPEPTIVLASTTASALSIAPNSAASSRTWRRSRHTRMKTRHLKLQMCRLRRVEPNNVQIRENVAGAVVVHDVQLISHLTAVAGISIGDNVFEDANDEVGEVGKDVTDVMSL